MTAWPASALLGLLSDPASATLKGRLAGFARRAREPGRCDADKLRGLRLPAGFSDGPAHPTHPTVTTGLTLLCWTAGSVMSTRRHRPGRPAESQKQRVNVPVSGQLRCIRVRATIVTRKPARVAGQPACRSWPRPAAVGSITPAVHRCDLHCASDSGSGRSAVAGPWPVPGPCNGPAAHPAGAISGSTSRQ